MGYKKKEWHCGMPDAQYVQTEPEGWHEPRTHWDGMTNPSLPVWQNETAERFYLGLPTRGDAGGGYRLCWAPRARDDPVRGERACACSYYSR